MKLSTSFLSNNIKIAADLYIPDNYQAGQRLPGIVVSHPMGGVKEQTAGLYASHLAENGFIAIAFDAAYQGASEGLPRFLEDPAQRAEDIRSAVSYLAIRPEVDSERIGALGICASGGYVPFTATTDSRIKAVATVSAADVGRLWREGLGGTGSREALQEMLAEVGRQRTREARGEEQLLVPIVPHTPDDVTPETPVLFREGTDYYRTPRAQHPNSPNKYLFTSIDRITAYSSYDRIELIAPRPLLMIAGSEADTRYFSEQAVARAGANAELFLVAGATHIAMYDVSEYVSQTTDKLVSFFQAGLQAVS